MRNVAGFTLTLASAFLVVVALMLNSAALFYMATALIATIGACRLQSWLSVKGLRFERVAPESVHVGDLVTVEITVWSDYKIRRPLIQVVDNRPAKLAMTGVTPSLPIAAAYDLPIRTQYQFRPLKRGRFRWTGLRVDGTDALGLVSHRRIYETQPAEMTVLPRPIPVIVDLPAEAGWGISEAESGQTRGAGLEPRGVRDYVSGDSLRHVHWRSTAKRGELLVKEFEAGTHAGAALILQRAKGSDLGSEASTSLDLMCGHAVYLCEVFLRQGVKVIFPGLEPKAMYSSVSERLNQIYEIFASIQADQDVTLGEQILAAGADLPRGSVLFVMISVADKTALTAIAEIVAKGTGVVPLLYDSHSFNPKSRLTSATDSTFFGALIDVGAMPTVMPIEVING